MNTSLSKNGYKIIKNEFESKIIKEIKDDLYVKPYTYTFNKMQNIETRFNVYLESPKKLYLPRFYGLQKLGEPIQNNIEEGDHIDLKFNGTLRDEQKPIEEIYLKHAKE